MSTNSNTPSSPPPPIAILSSPINYAPQPLPAQQMPNSPTIPPSNMLSPNAKPMYVEVGKGVRVEEPKRVGEEHKLVVEGVRLALEII